MKNKILLVDTTEYTLESFCKEHFPGCQFEDSYILIFEKKTYELYRCEEIGIEIKHVWIYRLEESDLNKA